MTDSPFSHITKKPGDIPDDSQLVKAARYNPEAFSALYERYVRQIYGYVFSHVGNVPDAEDLTAQIFMAALEGLGGYQHNGYFRAWLFGIARFKIGDFFRREKKLTSISDDKDIVSETDLLQSVVEQELKQSLAELMLTLSEEEQELLRLRYQAGLSFPEMAQLLKRTPEGVKKAVYRLVARIQMQMEVSNE